jgi:hypothetical protein
VADLSPCAVFIVITCLFCMMTFAHYTHRCVRLILKCSTRYGPIGWQRKWRLVCIRPSMFWNRLTFSSWSSLTSTLLFAPQSTRPCSVLGPFPKIQSFDSARCRALRSVITLEFSSSVRLSSRREATTYLLVCLPRRRERRGGQLW